MDLIEVFEVLALVFNLAYVALAIYQNVLCWPAGFVGAVFTLVVFLDARLRSNVLGLGKEILRVGSDTHHLPRDLGGEQGPGTGAMPRSVRIVVRFHARW